MPHQPEHQGRIMKKLILLTAWLCAMAFVVIAKPALAAGTNAVSYVSNSGSDSHGCTNPTTDACATFSGALNNTISGGEIDCVNAGNYGGGFSITQSVTIDCAGAVGFSPGGIIINGSGIVVRLRNLSINGGGAANFAGINAQNMAALYVEHCVITNNQHDGIYFVPTAGPSQLFVTDSIISANGTNLGNAGIAVEAAAGEIVATIERSRIEGNNGIGIYAETNGGSTLVTVSGTVVSGNQDYNFYVYAPGGAAWVLVDQTEVIGAGSNTGLFVREGGAEILARNTSVFNNGTGLFIGSGGAAYSYGTNSVNGNSTNGAFTGPVALK
jgi:hypothetical protein